MPPSQWSLAVAAVLTVWAVATAGQQDAPIPITNVQGSVTNLTMSYIYNGTLQGPVPSSQTFQLKSTDLSSTENCRRNDSWLLLEFYRYNSSGLVATDYVAGIAFVASRGSTGAQVYMTLDGGFVTTPPSNDQWQPFANLNGTYQDQEAIRLTRPYQRLLIPNVTTTNGTCDSDWTITLQNFAHNFNGDPVTINSYGIRATCLPPAEVPCARPMPTLGECSSNVTVNSGTCVLVNQTAPRDPLNIQCSCIPGKGDYACNADVAIIPTQRTPVSVSVPGQQWAFLQISVPKLQIPNQAFKFLVQMDRDITKSFGADPQLYIRPMNTSDRNVPTLNDINNLANFAAAGFYLNQDVHYIMSNDFSQGYDFYIGVYNNGPDSTFVGHVTVYWPTNSTDAICPKNCSGQGACSAPGPNTNTLFTCTCQPGIGGPLCDGTLTPITASVQGTRQTATLAPGTWAYYKVGVDNTFNFRTDEIDVLWTPSDPGSQPVDATQLYNAEITIDSNQYPQEHYLPGFNPPNVMREDYPDMVAHNDNLIVIIPSSFANGYYVVGIYNNQYTRSAALNSQLDIWVPVTPSAWLHPYLSVVLGVTAAVVLCMCMTVCKRLIMRYNHQPTAMWAEGGAGGAGATTVIQALMGGQHGVPQHIIDRLPTYTYVAPDNGKPAATDKPARMTPASRAQREALQVAAAEAASSAAAAVRARQEQQQQQQQQQLQQRQSAEGVEMVPLTSTPSETSTQADRASSNISRVSLDRPRSQRTSVEQQDAILAAAQRAAIAQHQAAVADPSAVSSTSGDAPHTADGTVVALGMPVEGRLPTINDEDVPACTVCLCEYEQGDMMRRLPCGHEFHSKCIDQWLKQHTNCPVCRTAVASDQELNTGNNVEGFTIVVVPSDRPENAANQQRNGRSRSWGSRIQEVIMGTAQAPNSTFLPTGVNAATRAWGNVGTAADPFASPVPMGSRRRNDDPAAVAARRERRRQRHANRTQVLPSSAGQSSNAQ